MPKNASDDFSDFLSAFGVSGEEPQEPTPTPEEGEVTPEEGEGEPTPDEDTEPKGDEENTPTEPTPEPAAPKANKANEAFAAMRTQNKQYKDLMKNVAALLDINGENPDEILTAVQAKAQAAQAKQQGIPLEVMQRLQQLEQKEAEASRLENQRQAYLAFEGVKNKFGLDNKSLEAFATQLSEKGLNPFEGGVDIQTEYIKFNYDNLIAQAEARGAQQEAQRAAKAQSKGSTPNRQNGGGQGDAEVKITTVKELGDWLEKQSK